MSTQDSEPHFPTGFVSYGSVPCPRCGADIELTAEADCWEEQDDGSMKITGYSPAMGDCERCDLLLVDDYYQDRWLVYDRGERW